jgi:HEPN domain-containing protein
MLAFGEEARYRLRLADGFLREAGEDLNLCRWRSCVDNSQLAAENAAKAVLALLGPVGRTHLPASLLRRALSENRFPDHVTQLVERLAECAELLGPEIHAGTDYGDESMWRTPWEIFREDDAKQAFSVASEAVTLAHEIFRLMSIGQPSP